MKHTYHIQGMTCNGCRTHVEETLSKIEGVRNASVDLEKAEAIIEMEHHIDVNTLQKSLLDKYSISEKRMVTMAETSTETKSKLEQLRPLFLILGYITVASILLNYNRPNWEGAMLDFMGLFYIVFSFFKMLDLKGFPDSFRMYDPLAKAVPFYAWVYPFIETILGVLFLMRLYVPFALIATLVVLGITTIGVTRTLLDKKSIQCACLGTALKLPMTEATFIENAIMIVMAISMLIGL
ncbi:MULTISPECIES: heavy-metal-associated domain-containing protein [Maribacter]|uniref:MauE/DoxX family redox-associated membrane protein n=1 Tax=Maribacter flavus TaxID=1658664 RepID=A0ABU7IJ95_9FLAO|nr:MULTISPECIES: MauE/DoxX family redox-associated membrane protein [Maribacter]MDC6405709.1 cation transporter [Maribacter sp. PR66]MEE1973039.1 MauE/DoxX family redox-associated membrane protein [Maribacter flavus]